MFSLNCQLSAISFEFRVSSFELSGIFYSQLTIHGSTCISHPCATAHKPQLTDFFSRLTIHDSRALLTIDNSQLTKISFLMVYYSQAYIECAPAFFVHRKEIETLPFPDLADIVQ